MWISNTVWTELHEDLNLKNVQIAALERALATSQANVDWLKVYANNAVNERNAIAASRGLQLPRPQIEGTPQSPEAVKNTALSGADKSFERAEDLDEAMETYRGSVGNFEDLGDAEAERQGVHHADDGTVEYTRR